MTERSRRIVCAALALYLTTPALAIEKSWLAPLDNKKWKGQNPGKPYSLQRVSAPRRGKTDSLRFEIRAGETWISNSRNVSYRTEVNTSEHVPMDAERWYGFSIRLPEDFPIEDNRLVLAQWWALTKEHLGEVHRSPPLQLRYADGKLSIRTRLSKERVVTDPEAYTEQKLFQTKAFKHGHWHDFVFHVKWSFTDDGFIDAWWNGEKIIAYKGQTNYNDEVGPKFKFGLYRDDTKATYVSYMSEVRMGVSFDAVNPSQRTADR